MRWWVCGGLLLLLSACEGASVPVDPDGLGYIQDLSEGPGWGRQENSRLRGCRSSSTSAPCLRSQILPRGHPAIVARRSSGRSGYPLRIDFSDEQKALRGELRSYFGKLLTPEVRERLAGPEANEERARIFLQVLTEVEAVAAMVQDRALDLDEVRHFLRGPATAGAPAHE